MGQKFKPLSWLFAEESEKKNFNLLVEIEKLKFICPVTVLVQVSKFKNQEARPS